MKTLISVVVAVIATYLVTSLLNTKQAAAPIANAPADSVIIPLSIVSMRENASTSPTIAVEYPQFAAVSDDFNALIASSTLGRLGDFKSAVADNMQARIATQVPGQPSAVIPESAYSFLASWQPAQINSHYISFVERYDSYSGGANETQELQTFNYDLVAHRPMTLDDILGTSSDYLPKLSALARQELDQSLRAASPGYDPTAMLDAGTEPTADNFRNFTFTNYAITVYFPKYAVAPGAFGEQHVTFPRSALSSTSGN
ncbi:MAG: DUF3298 domain-containing protein [Patescibacteria group bacterium]|nr:DUF3298 domain-containing protein [Patescibacteria group bacterium]MDE2172376.1 DUF3298 domain-containing protein [Patescibacteria group bacterium]